MTSQERAVTKEGPTTPIREARFRLMLQGGSVRLVAASNGAQALLGYSVEDFLSGQLALPRLIHADDRDIAETLFSPLTQSNQGDCNLRVRQASGRILCVKGHYRREAGAAGVILDLLLQDAKSLPRTMAEITTMPNFAAIMENTDDYIYFKDRNHVFTGASQTLVSLCAPAEHWTELIGHTDYDVFPETFADIYYRLEKQVFAGLPVAHEVQETLGKEGIKGWVDNRKYPIRDASGAIIGLYGIARDITALKQAETALARTTQLLERAGELAKVGGWEVDVQSMKLTWTPETFRIAEIDPPVEPPLAEGINLFAPEARPTMTAAIQAAIDTGTTYDLELPIITAKGRHRWVQTQGYAEMQDGKAVRLFGTFQDITDRKLAELELLRRKNTLNEAQRLAHMGSWELNSATKQMAWTEELYRICGVDPGEPTPSYPDHEKLVTPESWVRLDTAVKLNLATGQTFELELDMIRRDGSHGWLWIRGEAVRDDQGATIGLRGVALDITERKQAQAKLQLAASVFEHAGEGITITDTQGTIVDVNAAFTRITGYSREQAIGQNPRILKSGQQDGTFYEAMWRDLTEQGLWSGEVWNRRQNGEVYAEFLTISALRDAAGNVHQYLGLFSDITAIKTHQNQLEHMAHFDVLTNLPNRVLLVDRLHKAKAQARRRQQQLAVVYLDLDGFKTINDHHGHQIGDQVLITLAQRMKEALRDGDTIARMGGDEFVAVLTDLEEGMPASIPLLNRLLAAASLPVQVGDLSLQISASLGVTFYPQAQDIDADQLLRQADQAMYQAKVAGKNRYSVFDAAQDSSLRDHHVSVERIRLALARGEFVLHYQPKVNMRSGQVIGAEALIRWQHPERGLLAPAAFLPVIEDHPLAIDVGEWVIDTAMHQMEAWRAAGLDLPVSVNVGARQLLQDDFVERLQAILAKHPQVHPGCIELEVLETSALADMAQASQVIDDCASMGVKFALDDFGTGYSSLTYLKRLRVALLKIDQSFVRDMLDDPDDLAILQGIIGLAAAFKREVIAEGVETVAHGTALLQLGCKLAQGYGIARPMPAEQLPAWVAKWQPDAAWCAMPNSEQTSRSTES